MRRQAGFTLIELVVVLVLLGILGAVATAQFQDLSAEAANAVQDGTTAELSAASAINFAKFKAGGTPAVTISADGETCSTIAGSLLQSGVPDDITVADGTETDCGASDADGDIDCTVSHADATDAAEDVTILCTT